MTGISHLIAGVDEAGRGPLAGPVMAAAVILDPAYPIAGLRDSKQLNTARREALAQTLHDHALAYCEASASVEEIDQLNILGATLLAMQRAVMGLAILPGEVWVDGNRPPRLVQTVRTIVRGDVTVPVISAASILAKVARDRLMLELDRLYPGYGLARHKGYPTAEHLAALERLGPLPIHRQSFAPVRRLLRPTG
ncbi:MAG: ribonuclease HII [Pseudomonadota bacterium]